jgi:hypothetical protein
VPEATPGLIWACKVTTADPATGIEPVKFNLILVCPGRKFGVITGEAIVKPPGALVREIEPGTKVTVLGSRSMISGSIRPSVAPAPLLMLIV